MNVAGISPAPPLPATPAVVKVAASSLETGSQQRTDSHTDGKEQGRQDQRAAPQAPPLKPLSTTEMRVMMGGLPASALLAEQQKVDLTKAQDDGS